MSFQIHTLETAPAKSKAILEQVREKFGFIPNLTGVLAESPAILQGYMQLAGIVEQTTLSPLEQQIAFIETSTLNECHYCVAAHTVISSMQNLPSDVIQSLRENRPISDAKLETLRRFVRAVVENRGFVSETDTETFLAAGYTKENILEVVLIVGMKVLSNYANHIAATPVDGAFESAKWKKATA